MLDLFIVVCYRYRYYFSPHITPPREVILNLSTPSTFIIPGLLEEAIRIFGLSSLEDNSTEVVTATVDSSPNRFRKSFLFIIAALVYSLRVREHYVLH